MKIATKMIAISYDDKVVMYAAGLDDLPVGRVIEPALPDEHTLRVEIIEMDLDT